jgi:hypothetical protein
MLPILSDIAEKLNLKRGSGRWYGPCPECGGKASSDKFDLRDDGGYTCHGCKQVHGDLHKLLRTYAGMSCPEAYIATGRECTLLTCPGRSKCRLGDGSGDRTPRRPAPLQPPKKHERQLPVTTVTMPMPQWLGWASQLVESSIENLHQRQDDLAWLAARGINNDACIRFRLGWLNHDRKVDKQEIGLRVEQGKPKLWVPGGLLIAIYDGTGQLHRLRIRRTSEDRARFLPDLKYVWVKGSGDGPLVLRPAAGVKIRGAVILEAELDAYAIAAAHPEVMVIGLGTVGAGLPGRLLAELDIIPSILVSLDADQGKDGKAGAGPQAVTNWLRRYRQAKFWPVLEGKDPGNYFERGGDLGAWVEAGLVPKASAAAVKSPADQDLSFPPLCSQPGERGEVVLSPSLANQQRITKDTDSAADRYLAAIEQLQEPVLGDALAIHALMSSHPIYPWLSADGMKCGILASGDWKQKYREISARFTQLFYGPAHEPVCRIYREQFVATARLHGKASEEINA